MEQLSQESIENACRTLGLELPPSARVKIWHRMNGSSKPPHLRRTPISRPIRLSSITTDIPLFSGIYFFWREGTPFYVGQAVNLRQRLLSHPKKRYCDEVAWVACAESELMEREAAYIAILRPIAQDGRIEKVRCDGPETYYFEERVGDLVLTRSPEYLQPKIAPPPPGMILKFPGRAS
jgi:hypothetical protein